MATAIGTSWTKLVEYASTDTYTVTYRLYAKFTATNVADNTHTVQFKWTTQKTSGGTGVYDNNSTTPKVTNITNGNPSSWTGTAFTIPSGSATAETDRTTSGDIVITHNSNGTYSATWSWSLSHVYEGGSKSGTVAVTLPTIPRASSFTLSSNSISTAGSTTATITRADSSFAHKITTVYDGTTYYLLGSASATSTSTSASLTIPTALRSAMASGNAKSATLTLTLTTYSGSTVIGTATTSLTIAVPTATVSLSATSVNCNANITWTLANVDTTACRYTVTRKYSSITYTDTTKATTTSLAVANANFQTVMSTVTSGTVTTTVTTYVGTTTVGTSTATYTVKVPTGTYYWSVANGTTTYKGGKISGKSIAGLESVTQTFTCTNHGTSNSSTVNEYSVTCSRSDISLTVTKSGNTITVVTGTLPASATNYNFTLTCSISDTRGTNKSVTTGNILATGYQKPIVSGSASRVNSSGVADSTGTYAKVSANATATTATMTSVTIKYGSNTVASGTSSASASAYGGSFAVTSAYTFTVTATDSFGQTTTFKIQLPVASYEFNLYPGGGAGFGMVASPKQIDSAYRKFTVYTAGQNNTIDSGNTADTVSNYVRAVSGSGHIYLVASGSATGNKALAVMASGATSGVDIIRVNQNNDCILPRTTYYTASVIANNSDLTPGYFFQPRNVSDDSAVPTPGRIYYQTSVSGSEGRFMFREYSPTSADVTKFVNYYEYYGLPAPNKDRTSSVNYNILTTKHLVTEAQGGTGQSSLANVTVGNATNATLSDNSTTAYSLESAVAGKAGTTTTNRWYKIGTATLTSSNTYLDLVTTFLLEAPFGSVATIGESVYGIGRIKLRTEGGAVFTISGCSLSWLATSTNFNPANIRLVVSSADKKAELWVYAEKSYITYAITKLQETSRNNIQRNSTYGWKFVNKYSNEGDGDAPTSGYTEIQVLYEHSNFRTLYNNTTGTTGTVTLSETAENFKYLDIYYYTSHGSGSTPKRMGYTRVYAPNGTQVALTNTVYWSNQLFISQSQIGISGTSITRLSNEQSQWTLTSGSSPTRSATSTNLYIYRVDGLRA